MMEIDGTPPDMQKYTRGWESSFDEEDQRTHRKFDGAAQIRTLPRYLCSPPLPTDNQHTTSHPTHPPPHPHPHTHTHTHTHTHEGPHTRARAHTHTHTHTHTRHK